MQIVDAHIESRLFAGFLDDRVDFALRLVDHLFDPCRMDASVHDELLERESGDLSSDRIKT